MPPRTAENQLGWKFFFGIMAFVQAAGLAIAFIVWGILSDVQKDVQEVKQRQQEVILVELAELKQKE